MAENSAILAWTAGKVLDCDDPHPDNIPSENDFESFQRDRLNADVAAAAADALMACVRIVSPPSESVGTDAAVRSTLDLCVRGLAHPTSTEPLNLRETWELWRKAVPIAAGAGLDPPPNPIEPIMAAWVNRGHPPEQCHLMTQHVMEGNGAPALPLVRAPALFDGATLTALEVDGEPFATASPTRIASRGLRRLRRRRVRAQGELFPAPKTLDGDVFDPVLMAAAELSLTGDERSPIRGDVIRIGRVNFALTGPILLTPSSGAWFIGGKDTPENQRRWWNALGVLQGMTLRINEETGEWRNMAVIDIYRDGTAALRPPAWWVEQRTAADKKFRLAGGLMRPVLTEARSRGPGAGYWGETDRTVEGFEALLGYSIFAGKGRDGSIPDLLRPARGAKSGPGPEVFIPWRQVLRASGEHVADDTRPRSTEGKRYLRRIAALKNAGYFAAGEKAAPARDTVEIVKQRAGTRGRDAGVWVRATARFTEAQRRAPKKENWTLISAAEVFGRSRESD